MGFRPFGVQNQDLDSNDPRRASIFDAFVAAGFAWSVRKKRRVAARRSSDGFEPQIVWKIDANGGRQLEDAGRLEIYLDILAEFSLLGRKIYL